MQRVYEFLKAAGTYYLATVEGDQPRVRPFGTVDIFEDKLYIQTGKSKKVSAQIQANPKVELCWSRTTASSPKRRCSMPILSLGRCTTRTTATLRCFTSKTP